MCVLCLFYVCLAPQILTPPVASRGRGSAGCALTRDDRARGWKVSRRREASESRTQIRVYTGSRAEQGASWFYICGSP